MPQIAKHVESSKARTGREHREVHEWIDDPEKKNVRHNVTKVMEFGRMFKEKYGEQAVEEYVAHLHDDLKGKFGHVVEDAEKAAKETAEGHMNALRKLAGRPMSEHELAIVENDLYKRMGSLVDELSHLIENTLTYFGVRNKLEDPSGVADSDVAMLRRAGVSEEDIDHCRKVARKAVEIARRTGRTLDMDLIVRGALFHDLGKAKTHAIEHGRIGATLGKDMGLPEAVNDIMEKHIRGGLTEAEAVELGLPVKDYHLKSLEERIIIYADRLVDIITDGVVENESEAEERFEEILAGNIKYGKNDLTLQRYLGYHREIQGLMAESSL